jgi:alkanesulfonate monooxygenase SsuD/methylene tetrahydromethanopterin reductase-like flavin-dependent oxidoreductase (luciferase family)
VNNNSTNPVFNSNKLKLGTFCTNTVPNMTFVPEMRLPTWENTLACARLADDAGLEAIVPIARWKGYLDDKADHTSNIVFETFTWAAGMAAATKYSAIFATSHAPTMHPMLIAKESATIDAISGGRFTLNVVGGWNRREFDMFGIDLLEHDQRYVYLEEWLQLLRRLWTSRDEFDYQSKNFRMKKAISRPHPLQPGGVPVMNAALSPTGMRFSAKYSDIGLISPHGATPEEWRGQIEDYKKMAREEFGRDIQLWTNCSLVQRETQKAAEDYLRRYSEEYLDTEVMDSLMQTISVENNIPAGSERLALMRHRMAIGAGHPLIGTAHSIAQQLAEISRVGIDGVIMTWVDYIDGLDRFNREVLPLLEQAGLRKPFNKKSPRQL